MKTTRPIFALIVPAGLVLLWAIPILTSNEFDAGWFAIEFCVLMGAYIVYAHPGLFSFIPRRDRKVTYRTGA